MGYLPRPSAWVVASGSITRCILFISSVKNPDRCNTRGRLNQAMKIECGYDNRGKAKKTRAHLKKYPSSVSTV